METRTNTTATAVFHIIRTDGWTGSMQARFCAGWNAAGGYTGDAEAATPWACPWTYADYIRVSGRTPEEWGASWWASNREEIEDILAYED